MSSTAPVRPLRAKRQPGASVCTSLWIAGSVTNGSSWFSITGVVVLASVPTEFSAGPRFLANGSSCSAPGR